MANVDEDDYEKEDIGSGSFATDKLITYEPGWKGFKYFDVGDGRDRTMLIKFSKFYDKDSKFYEEFITSCVSKKAYHKMAKMFCNTTNIILNRNKKASEQFLYKYYCIKRNIDHSIYEHAPAGVKPVQPIYVQFINAIDNLFDADIMNEIRKYVKENYKETGDKKWKENQKTFVPSITFLDYHIKVLYVVSRMIHFIVPLCLEYMHQYNEIDVKQFLADTFISLFPIAQKVHPDLIPLDKDERETDVYQKLYSFVESKVKDTLKSDETMWERQSFLGVNYKTTIETIVNKLIVDIVPEYSFCGNVMHMNFAVVGNSIRDYTFRKKDPYNINCLVDTDNNSSDDDNAVVTEAEQFDSFNAKHDEFAIVIRHVFAEDTVNKILMRKNVVLNPAEEEFYFENVKYHEFQTFAIFSSMLRYFGGTENIYGINKRLYVKLMLCVSQMLTNAGLPNLAKYVLGTKNRHYLARKENRLTRSILLADPMYNHIINTKYKSVKNVITRKNNFIESKINLLTNNEYLFNTPNKNLNGRIIPLDENGVRQDVLSFYNSFIY